MSDVPQTLTTILNNLALDFRPRVVRAINRRSVLLTVLPIVMGSGKNVTWDIETSGANAETFNDGDDASNFNSDAIVAPTLGWGLVRSNFRVGDVAVVWQLADIFNGLMALPNLCALLLLSPEALGLLNGWMAVRTDGAAHRGRSRRAGR